MNPPNFRLPPHSVEAEQQVLGALILRNDSWARIADTLTPGDFYRHDHQLIFGAIATMANRGEDFDLVAIAEHLRELGKLQEAGGMAYVGEVISATPSAANIIQHANRIKELATRRLVIQLGKDLEDAVFAEGERDSAAIISEAGRLLTRLSERTVVDGCGPVLLKDAMPGVIERIQKRYDNGDALIGLSTGFKDLDRYTGGMPEAEMIVLGARPGMGKTAFATEIALHVAIEQKKPVLFVTIEMTTEGLIDRVLATVGGIDLMRLRSGQLQDDEWPKLMQAVERSQLANLHILDAAKNVADVHGWARQIDGLSLVIVDYLTLLDAAGENNVLRVGAISKEAKQMAKALKVPVLMLAQLNRGIEHRDNKRPVQADLRESGQVEQDADQIWFIYRDEYYRDDSPDKGTAEILIEKNRNGPKGMVRLTFNGPFARFANYASEDRNP